MTVRLTVDEWLPAGAEPVIVRVEVAAGVAPVVLTVSVELPLPVIEVGLKAAVPPAGRPVMDRVTFWALPEVTAVATV